MKKSKNYLALPAIVLAALYLTFLIDLHTLETALQRVFIFCYFVVMGVLACFLKGKYAVGKPFPLQSRKLRDVERQGGFPHRGARGDDVEATRLETGGKPVEIDKAG